jgi:hypothetical protein
MNADYGSRFTIVDLLDEHGQPTGQAGQMFGKLVDANGDDTGKVAIMLTKGGQGCKHWPASQVKRLGDKSS